VPQPDGCSPQRDHATTGWTSFPSSSLTPPIRRLKRRAELTIGALRDAGRLERCESLLVALLRTTAEVADERRDDPAQAFHLTQTLKLLAELDGRLRTIAGPVDDAFDELLAAARATGP
jgi:hypothetical protein